MVRLAEVVVMVALAVGAVPAIAARSDAPVEIAVGDPQRRTLLETLRPAVERELSQPVRFVVTRLRVQGAWAFAHVVPQKPGGTAIDFRRTRHVEQIAQGLFDGPDLYALLERKGGRWGVRTFVIGPTDVVYAGWAEEYGAPETLFVW